MATNTSLQVHSAYIMATNTSLQVHSAYIHGYQHITPSTLSVHTWLPAHHSKYSQRTSLLITHHFNYTQRTSMATTISHQVHSAYMHCYQHITPSTLSLHPWLPVCHSKYTQRTSIVPTHHTKNTQHTSIAINTSLQSRSPSTLSIQS